MNRRALVNYSVGSALCVLAIVLVWFKTHRARNTGMSSPNTTDSAPVAAEPGSTVVHTVDVAVVPKGKTEVLKQKGFPAISNPRREAIAQVENKSMAEMAADMGNMVHLALTQEADEAQSIMQISPISHAIQTNLYVLRLIEEGHQNPDAAAHAIGSHLTEEMDSYEALLKAYSEDEMAKHWADPPIPTETSYYKANLHYQSPHLEVERIHRVIYYSFYVLLNIGKIDNVKQLMRWEELSARRSYGCMEFEMWLIDSYVRRGACDGGGVRTAWEAAVGDRVISDTSTIRRSAWNESWSATDLLIKAKNVDSSVFRSVDILAVPLSLPIQGAAFQPIDMFRIMAAFQEASKK